MEEDVTGFDLAVGTVEEAKASVGETSDRYRSADRVNRAMIRFYAALLEDKNPSYWDEDFARRQWGGIRSPLGMLRTWRIEPLWHPERDAGLGSGPMAARVPLPEELNTIINVRTEVTGHRPILEGDRLNWRSEVVDVSDEKSTRLGRGHFVTTRTAFRNGEGLPVGEYENVMLRYAPDEEPDEYAGDPVTENRYDVERRDAPLAEADYESLSIEDVDEGEAVPSFDYPLSYRRVVHNAAATRDFYPGHHDPEFARAQGTPSIYLNTMTFQGLVDRLALDWAGPEWRVAERTIHMQGSAVVGDRLTVEGSVVGVDPDGPTVEIEGGVYSNDLDRMVCPAAVTITTAEQY